MIDEGDRFNNFTVSQLINSHATFVPGFGWSERLFGGREKGFDLAPGRGSYTFGRKALEKTLVTH